MKTNTTYGIYDFSDYAEEITGTDLFLINGGGPSCSGGAQVTGACGGGSSASDTGNGTSAGTTTAPTSCSGGSSATESTASVSSSTESTTPSSETLQPETPVNQPITSGIPSCGGGNQTTSSMQNTFYDNDANSGDSAQELKTLENKKIIPKQTDKYEVDLINMVVKVDINDRESYENAYNVCWIKNIDEGLNFKLQIVNGNDIVHTFSSLETAKKYVTQKGVSSNLLRNEKNVMDFVLGIEENSDNYFIEAYQRRALGEGKRTRLMTHSLYLITDRTTGEQSTLSFNGNVKFPYSTGAWALNTKYDVLGWNSYVDGDNKYDMSVFMPKERVNVAKTALNISYSINSNTKYYYRDHVKNNCYRENCNTALVSTMALNINGINYEKN